MGDEHWVAACWNECFNQENGLLSSQFFLPFHRNSVHVTIKKKTKMKKDALCFITWASEDFINKKMLNVLKFQILNKYKLLYFSNQAEIIHFFARVYFWEMRKMGKRGPGIHFDCLCLFIVLRKRDIFYTITKIFANLWGILKRRRFLLL